MLLSDVFSVRSGCMPMFLTASGVVTIVIDEAISWFRGRNGKGSVGLVGILQLCPARGRASRLTLAVRSWLRLTISSVRLCPRSLGELLSLHLELALSLISFPSHDSVECVTITLGIFAPVSSNSLSRVRYFKPLVELIVFWFLLSLLVVWARKSQVCVPPCLLHLG